jgi:hypothetical protein
VLEPDMNRSISESWASSIISRWPSDRWDPVAAHIPGFRYFDAKAAQSCVRGKRVMIAGDSTTRDTFYEFSLVAGHPMFPGQIYNDVSRYWPPTQYEPRAPHSSGGSDVRGMCIGNFDKKKMCWRDERHPDPAGGPETRLGFQFLTRANSTWEIERAQTGLADRQADVLFIQCPIYEYFKPDAYDYTKTKSQRHKLADERVGPRHFEAMGVACLQYIEQAVRASSPSVQVFALGITPLPGWTRTLGGEHVEAIVFRSINTALGMRCHRRRGTTGESRLGELSDSAPHSTAPGANNYALTSRRGILPIDRYAIVGPRRRDMIHPFFNAQFATVQLMLNHMCPL